MSSQATSSTELDNQLARDYQVLAEMWDELADDLAVEQWLILENEALLSVEKLFNDDVSLEQMAK
jgi:hypothetical protein